VDPHLKDNRQPCVTPMILESIEALEKQFIVIQKYAIT